MAKRLELTGKRFGKLVALEDIGNNSRGYSMWRCRCDCGNITDVKGSSLMNGDTKSCGCLKGLDLTGRRFGKLVALESVGRRNNWLLWRCKCDCGKITDVASGNLTSGHTLSCGCLREETKLKNRRDKQPDLTGKRFGKLVVLKSEVDSNGKLLWKCKCDCGNIRLLSTTELTHKYNGKKSCGCLWKQNITKRGEIELTGRKIGQLEIIGKSERKNSICWKCKCSCGKIIEVSQVDLITQSIKSCGQCKNK